MKIAADSTASLAVADNHHRITKPGPSVLPSEKHNWAQSVWFHLTIALIAGPLYAVLVLGPAPVNPRNTNWLTPDPATQYIGWELFRQDPHLNWPLTLTKRLNYPYGESVSLLDLNPLIAIALKPFSSAVPEPLQYFGPEVVLICILQFFFALRLFRWLLPGKVIGILLCAAFFLTAPPLTFRLPQHYSLSNQWLLVAAISLFVSAVNKAVRLRKLFVAAVALITISVGTNPYLAFPVILIVIATVTTLVIQRELTNRCAAALIGAFGVISVIVAFAVGFIIAGGRGYASTGYRYFSLNLNSAFNASPFDPPIFKSLVIPSLQHATPGQYEGFNYLGAGVLALAAIVLLASLFYTHEFRTIKLRRTLPLLLCCCLLSLLALTTKITLNSATILDIDPAQRLSPYLAALRASGRLFWTPYYVILTGVLAAPFLFFRKSWATALLAVAFLLQWADTVELRRWAHAESNREHLSPLTSPIWAKLGSIHRNLIVLPPWQCDTATTPGGSNGYRIFGFLAVQQHMTINSYYSGRYTEALRDLQCANAVSDVNRQSLSPDSAYVVSPLVAKIIADGPTGEGKCHDVDGFILCSVKMGFELGPAVTDPVVSLQHAIANPGFENTSVAPWNSYETISARVSSDVAHSGKQSLAETDGEGSLYQDVSGLQPGRTYVIAAWLMETAGNATGQVGVYDPGAKIATFSTSVPPRPGWQLVTDTATVSQAGTLRIHLLRNKGSGTIYWDDISIYVQR